MPSMLHLFYACLYALASIFGWSTIFDPGPSPVLSAVPSVVSQSPVHIPVLAYRPEPRRVWCPVHAEIYARDARVTV